MVKAERQKEIIKLVAVEPWVYAKQDLAALFKASVITIQRDIQELIGRGYHFILNAQKKLYLKDAGWPGPIPAKSQTLRQMEILRVLSSFPNGLTIGTIAGRISRDEPVSTKTIERDIKGLEIKGLVDHIDGQYRINTKRLLAPLHLEPSEHSLLFEAIKVASDLAPLKEEMKSLEAKLRVMSMAAAQEKDIVLVHGRTPTQDIHRSHYCHILEEAAREKVKVWLLYRRENEPARELTVNPLGIVYYWALDSWYLIAVDGEIVKTYAVDRILAAEKTRRKFTPPNDFALEEWYKLPWGIYKDNKPVAVKIRFYDYHTTLKRVRDELKDLRSECRISEDEQGIIVEDTVEGLEDLAVWLRGFGPGVEVIEPMQLRDKVKEELLEVFDLYK